MYGPLSQKLFDMVAGEVYRYSEQPFQLSSGGSSHHYFNCRKITLHPERLHLLGHAIRKEIFPAEKIADEIDAVGGMTMGADPVILVLALGFQEEGRLLYPLVVRKEAKGHGMGRRIEGEWESATKVLVIDDVVTTGGSTIKAVAALREAGLEVSIGICVIDREEGGSEVLAVEGVKLCSVFKKTDFRL